MAGVPIFTESPINAAVEAPQSAGTTGGVPPSPSKTTVLPSTSTTAEPAQSTNMAAIPSSKYTPIQPGAAPPAPTNPPLSPYERQPTPTQTQHPLPTSATSTPPPPQPSHLPMPPISKSRSPSPRRDIPPPPKAGEKMMPASYYSPAPTPTYGPATQSPQASPYPPQFGMAPISNPRAGGQPPASATSFDGQRGGLLSPQAAYGSQYSPAQTPTGERRSFDHPEGYVQNPYAADMTPEQRFNNQRNGNFSPGLGYGSYGGAPSPGAARGGGILTGDGKAEDTSVMGMVGGWVKGAGKMLGQLENEAWKRINKE